MKFIDRKNFQQGRLYKDKLTGNVYALVAISRPMNHNKLYELIKDREDCPFDIKYVCGACLKKCCHKLEQFTCDTRPEHYAHTTIPGLIVHDSKLSRYNIYIFICVKQVPARCTTMLGTQMQLESKDLRRSNLEKVIGFYNDDVPYCTSDVKIENE